MSTTTTPDAHRVRIAGHVQPGGNRQWLVSCVCGWSAWNVHTHGAEAWAREHLERAGALPAGRE